MKLIHICRRLAGEIRQNGVSGMLDIVGGHFLERERRDFESRCELDTESIEMLDDLTIDSGSRDNGFYYAPSPPRVVHAFLANVPAVDGFSFVDFGSGKGLVLFVAAEYPFAEIIGVEFARELHETACANIQRYQNPQQRCAKIRSVCQDAAQFEIPSENCVLYFCNPFNETIMQSVLENISASHAEHKQKIYILFHQLKVEEATTTADPIPLFEEASFLRERPVTISLRDRFLMRQLRLKMYESI